MLEAEAPPVVTAAVETAPLPPVRDRAPPNETVLRNAVVGTSPAPAPAPDKLVLPPAVGEMLC